MAGGMHVQLGRETNPWLAPAAAAAAAGCRGKTKALETLLRRPAGGNMQDNGLLHNWMIAIGILAMQADINHSKEKHLLPTAFLQWSTWHRITKSECICILYAKLKCPMITKTITINNL